MLLADAVDGDGTDTAIEAAPAGVAKEQHALEISWLSADGGLTETKLSGRNSLLVGRGADCDVVLEGSLVSRRHARLSHTAGAWRLQDLASRNGSFLNGAPATHDTLTPGSVLRLGSWIGVVRPAAPAGTARFAPLGDDLLGGPELAHALRWVTVAAGADIPVVLEGETGTGKELFARAIHRRSGRRGPLLAVNCAVLQPATAAAELFGYRRGAFTGAVDGHSGLVRAANGGTLFLDEIADLSLDVQAQLLRVVEQRELTPLGESRAIPVDVRFVVATQRPLADWVSLGRLRADLRARLEGIRIELPPLRRRWGDAPLLFLHLLAAHSANPPQPDARVLEWLALRDWPLNVRELVALVRRVLATYPSCRELTLDQIAALSADAAPRIEGAESTSPARSRRPRNDRRAFGPEALAALRVALERNSGSVTRAAAELAISRQRAYRMLKSSAKRPPA